MDTAYTTGEAARIAGLSLSTLKRCIVRGDLEAYRTPGGDRRIRHDALMAFLRTFGIPAHETESGGRRIALAVADEAYAGALVARLESTGGPTPVRCRNTLELGWALADDAAGLLVAEANTPSSARRQCEAARRLVRPRRLRVGMIVPGAAERLATHHDGPDVVVSPSADAAWTETLLRQLLAVPAMAPEREASTS